MRGVLRYLLSFLILPGLLLGGCGRAEGPEISVPWEREETIEYGVRQRGIEIGTLTLEVSQEEAGWVLKSATRTENVLEEIRIVTDLTTLVPLEVDYSVTSPAGEVTYTALYGDKTVDIKARRPDGEQEAQVRLPAPPYYDNEQFIFLLRSLPLEEGYRQKLNLILTRAASKTELTVRVVALETIETSLGQTEAWKVELLGTDQYGWVETAPPHRLLRYENLGAETVTLINRVH